MLAKGVWYLLRARVAVCPVVRLATQWSGGGWCVPVQGGEKADSLPTCRLRPWETS
jgi:hypothetical protein